MSTLRKRPKAHATDLRNPKVEVRETPNKGRGVFACKKIRKDEVVARFDGPIYDDDFEGWTTDLQNHTIQVGPALWRDSLGPARYMNHSCEPNCGIRGLYTVVAMRTIHPGEEMTWDYEMTEKSDWWRLHCRCGAKDCRKVIGTYANLPRRLRQKYVGYISTWLQPRKRRPRAV